MATMGLLLLLVVVLLTVFIARVSTLGSLVGKLRERVDRLERALAESAAGRAQLSGTTAERPPQPAAIPGVSPGDSLPAASGIKG